MKVVTVYRHIRHFSKPNSKIVTVKKYETNLNENQTVKSF